MTVREIREVLEWLAGPKYAPEFEDALDKLAEADDEQLDKDVRIASGEVAASVLDELAADLAAEFAARELVGA